MRAARPETYSVAASARPRSLNKRMRAAGRGRETIRDENSGAVSMRHLAGGRMGPRLGFVWAGPVPGPSGGRCEEASGGRIAQRDRTGPPHDDETVLSKSHAVLSDRSATGASKQQGGRCSDRRPLRPAKGGGGEGIWRRRDGPA